MTLGCGKTFHPNLPPNFDEPHSCAATLDTPSSLPVPALPFPALPPFCYLRYLSRTPWAAWSCCRPLAVHAWRLRPGSSVYPAMHSTAQQL